LLFNPILLYTVCIWKAYISSNCPLGVVYVRLIRKLKYFDCAVVVTAGSKSMHKKKTSYHVASKVKSNVNKSLTAVESNHVRTLPIHE